ncbi:lipocalin-like domain-containing protein [Marinibacterium sp. SX1]|uniref:lipocalin-like domain-containing protein n=1 Tax=Marinibacterium sp. SX1 TaxID=3388424 RepID=UPI003D16E99A
MSAEYRRAAVPFALRALAVLLALLMPPATARAQGFAALGTTAEGFAVPDPARRLVFPRDHGPHPDFRIEWWYLTANLTGADGRDYGVQWTLFRSALRPEPPGATAQGWTSPQVWMAHAALTTPDAHHFAERFSRGGIGTAGATATPFAAWIDDWQMTGTAAPGDDGLQALELTARGDYFAYDLALAADGPLVLHGQEGFSVKSPDGRASHYYSQPHYRVTGTIRTPRGEMAVTGTGWLDREWSSQPLAGDQSGWDWMALTLETGERLMAAQLRDGGAGFRFGTWIARDGNVRALSGQDLALSPGPARDIGPARLPLSWRIDLPGEGLALEIEALNPGAWMGTTTSYWEGPVRVGGDRAGRGYLEMTGYDGGE